jgi:hypothetical protein
VSPNKTEIVFHFLTISLNNIYIFVGSPAHHRPGLPVQGQDLDADREGAEAGAAAGGRGAASKGHVVPQGSQPSRGRECDHHQCGLSHQHRDPQHSQVLERILFKD